MEAEKYRLEKLAEANKKRVILEAEAESEAVRKKGLFDWKYDKTYLRFHLRSASEEKQKRSQLMPRQRQKQNKWQRKLRPSENTVSVTRSLSLKNQFTYQLSQLTGEAAMVEMLLDTLPKVAAEVAAPLSQAKKITMVSSGTGEIGAAKLTGEVLQIVNKVPELVKAITGVDISRVINQNHKFI